MSVSHRQQHNLHSCAAFKVLLVLTCCAHDSCLWLVSACVVYGLRRVSLLKTGFAEIAAIHQAHSQLGEQQQQHEQQPSMAEQQTVQLEAGLSDSEHDRMQFTQRKQQQQVDWNNPPSNGQLGLHGDKMEQHQGPLIHAPTKPSHVADTSSACQEVSQIDCCHQVLLLQLDWACYVQAVCTCGDALQALVLQGYGQHSQVRQISGMSCVAWCTEILLVVVA